MQKQIYLVLGDNEVGQIIDGLLIREEAWLNTAKYLETEELPNDEFFLIEECSDADEARNIASDYRAIIEKIQKQQTAQRQLASGDGEILQPPKEGSVPGYAIYVDTLAKGRVPVERSDDKPIVYATERNAQFEIVDSTILRLQQFLSGERDHEDATYIEEYIVPVDLHPDGSITDEAGKTFPNPNW